MEVLSSRVILTTPDLPRLRKFYEVVLGLRPYREYGAGGEVLGVVFFAGGGFIELTGGPPAAASAGMKLWLQVADLATEHRRLAAAGVRILQPPTRMPWGLEECWVLDPDGWELRLIEVPDDHPLRRRVE